MAQHQANHSDPIALLAKAASETGLRLSGQQLDSFRIYQRELLFWNRRSSLVSLKGPSDLPIKHFFDSLTMVPFMPEEKFSLLDIGAGAGFPGIPVKIVLPQTQLTLIESVRKKVSFLRELTRKLGIEANILHGRAEELAQGELAGAFRVVTSRAALKLADYLKIGGRFLSPEGLLVAMKGGDFQAELSQIEGDLQALRMRREKIVRIRLPITGERRIIIIFSNA